MKKREMKQRIRELESMVAMQADLLNRRRDALVDAVLTEPAIGFDGENWTWSYPTPTSSKPGENGERAA